MSYGLDLAGDGKVLPVDLLPAARKGWFRVADGAADPAALIWLQRLPGVMPGPTSKPQLWVPWNIATAFPQRFNHRMQIPVGVPQVAPPAEGLRAYQRECVDFGLTRGGHGVYLGLDLGLGKTIIATSIAAAAGMKRVVVLGPMIARAAWCGAHSDPTRWYGIQVQPLSGRKDIRATAEAQLVGVDAGWFFCHYDVVAAWTPWFLTKLRPQCVIFDELDFCRNPRSRMSRAARALARLSSVDLRIGLTGTPISNGVMDMWAQLDALEPDAWGNRESFGVRYANGHQGEYGMMFDRALEETYAPEFHARLKFMYVRRSRSEVLHELPPITRQRICAVLDAEVMEGYNAAARDVRGYLSALGRGIAPGSPEVLARISVLLRLLALAKVPATTEAAKQALATEGRVVVFSWFKDAAKQIAKGLGKAALPVAHGDMPVEKRRQTAQDFAVDDGIPKAFVATIAAAGTSLNGLQAGHVVILSDFWWTPARILQAEGRVWRSGQTHPVTGIYTCAEGTIDEDLLDALMTKADSAASAADDPAAQDLMADLRNTPRDELAALVAALERRLAADAIPQREGGVPV